MYLLFPATKNLLKCRKLITCSHIYILTHSCSHAYILIQGKHFFLLRRFMKYTRCINMIKYSNTPCYVYLNPHEMWLNNKKWIQQEEVYYIRAQIPNELIGYTLYIDNEITFMRTKVTFVLPNLTSNFFCLQKQKNICLSCIYFLIVCFFFYTTILST